MHAAGTDDALEAVAAGCRWALYRVRRYVERHGLRLLNTPREVGDLFVGVDEARHLLAAADAPEPPSGAEALRRLGLLIVEATPAPPPEARGPLAGLARRFDLSPLDARLLFAAAAPALSLDVARLYAFAWADFAVKQPSAGFLCELVTDGPRAAIEAQARFRPDAPLVAGRLVRLNPTPSWAPHPPRLHCGVTAPAPVIAALRGEPPFVPEALAFAVTRVPPPRLPPTLNPDTARRLGRLVERAIAEPDGGPRLLLVGPAGSGRRTALAGAMANAGRRLVAVELGLLPAEPTAFAATLADAAREARIGRAGLLLRGDRLAEHDEAAPRWMAVIERMRAHRGLVALSVGQPPSPLRRHLEGAVEVRFRPLPAGEQRAVWMMALGAVDAEVEPELPAEMARRYDAPIGVIRGAVLDAEREVALLHGAPGRPRLDADTLDRCVRRRLHHTLDEVADRVTTSLRWSDVVLPDEVMDALHRVRLQARHRERVLDGWGFRRLLSYGRGLGCLFSGPPGTGKTMVAGLLAADLRRPLYRVDLSRVVSKWVGETEKNLARVFDEAERAQAILFFDEADSLFATRTEVKGSNDRFANMEINYLLQRMEDFDGMSILATNFERSLDSAFKRRLKFRIHFPLPDDEARAELWRRAIPSRAPVDGAIDFARLGKRYKLSGGSIKNAVLRAAFEAVDRGGGLTGRLLREAAETELREMGRL